MDSGLSTQTFWAINSAGGAFLPTRSGPGDSPSHEGLHHKAHVSLAPRALCSALPAFLLPVGMVPRD